MSENGLHEPHTCVYVSSMYGYILPLWDLQIFHTHVILLNSLQDRDTLDSVEVWRYRRGNHNPYIEEAQTTQWPKEKGQKDKQRSTKLKIDYHEPH